MMQREFKSSIHILSGLLLTILPTGLIAMGIFILFESDAVENKIASIVFLLLGLTFFWILFDTKYRFDESHLYYYSGPVRGNIPIYSIRKIKHQKGFISESFLKPALGYNGLYIYYNQFDDIYISPKDKEAFVNYLLTINPKIDII
jgi:hypothetical protein